MSTSRAREVTAAQRGAAREGQKGNAGGGGGSFAREGLGFVMACRMQPCPGMRHALGHWLALLLGASGLSAVSSRIADAREATAGDVAMAPDRLSLPASSAHPCPRLKMSVNGFAIANFDGEAVPLRGVHLDAYPLSERWMRGGFRFEAGTGHATAVGSSIALTYGLIGFSAGVQYPARVTPFLEGHWSGGVLSGRQQGSLTVGDTTIRGASGTTWLYGGGLDLGTEFYVVGRAYVSVAVGWMHTTWGAPDLTARLQSQSAPSQSGTPLVNMTSDSFLWRVGIGI